MSPAQSARVPEVPHWAPPDGRALAGARVRLERFEAARHVAPLWQAFGGGTNADLFAYLPYGPFDDFASFATFAKATYAGDDPLFYVITGAEDGAVLGIASYLRITPQHGVIEVGHICFSHALQRTPAATEAMALMMGHVFDDLGYRRYEWKCNAQNVASRHAALRLGFSFEGIFRQHMMIKGQNRDTAWFSILDHEWPAARAAFATYLDPANFHGDGQQHRSLAEIREASR